MANKSDAEKAKAFADIKQRVDDNGGVLSLQAKDLRDALGASSLKRRVREEIEGILREKGIGCSPAKLPGSAPQKVRLYTLESRLQEALKEHEGFFSKNADAAIIRSVRINNRHEDVLNKIRKVLEEEDV